ncbi:unnamed protein product [Caenorhabditis angaria]|uniref:BZIP domain-containing protein n=1 Tax=Caenorhabditis angaria TaxID=860376 RepID=A0A9P1IIU8_9PELO|nr:unnamed protein product [Caenorhabditis angaria]
MNMIPTAAQYTMPSFDPAYFNYAAYPLNQMYQHPSYCPDYSKSDSNSDESLNDSKGEHHKLSPKYREKRAKNNEAAKKSRLNRKQREKNLQEENNRYKATIHEQQKVIEELQRQLDVLRNGGGPQNPGGYSQREQHFEMIQGCVDEKYMALRDSTNQLPPQSQQPPQMMVPDHMAFNFKSL